MIRKIRVAPEVKKEALRLAEATVPGDVFAIENSFVPKAAWPKRLLIHNLKKTIVVQLSELAYMESSGPYTVFVMKNGVKHTASKILKYYNDLLIHHPDFIRIHRAHVINKNFLASIVREKHYNRAVMTDSTMLEISPKLRNSIFDMLVS